MTIRYWSDGEELEHYSPKTVEKPFRNRRTPRKFLEEDLEAVEYFLRRALEYVALTHPTSIRKLMEAPEGTPTVRARGKRTTSEPRSDYDSWKPHYSWEED
jgi:hypothetical protein